MPGILTFDIHSFASGIVVPAVLWLFIVLAAATVLVWTVAGIKHVGVQFTRGFSKGMGRDTNT